MCQLEVTSHKPCGLTMWSKAKKMIKGFGTSVLLGGQCKAKGKDKGKGKAKEGTETQAGEDSKENAAGVKKQDAQQANATRRRLISETKGKNNIRQVEEDDRVQHDQPDEEIDMGTFDMYASEDVKDSKNDASKSTTSKISKTPATGLTPSKHAQTLRKEHNVTIFLFRTRDAPSVGRFVQVSRVTRDRLFSREVAVLGERRVAGSRAACHLRVFFLWLSVFVLVRCWSKWSSTEHW